MYGGKSLFKLLSLIAVMCLFGLGTTQAQTYSGQATAIKSTVTVPGVTRDTTTVADTGQLPRAGGNITVSSASARIANVLTAGLSTASTSGSGGMSQSSASVETLNVGLVGNTITADTVRSTTQCSCSNGIATCTGSSALTNFRINNLVVAVTGQPNQTIPLFLLGVQVGTVVINEQMSSPGSITVNALHITTTDPATGTTTDVIIASSHSDINCSTAPPSSNLYSGRATGVQSTDRSTLTTPPTTSTVRVADTGPLPASGGSITVNTASTNLPNLLTTGALMSSTSGSGNSSQSSSRVENTNLLIGGNTITADVLTANTQCTCGATGGTCTGSSQLTNLRINNVVVTATGQPNQTIVITAGTVTTTIIINEQITSPGSITVNALHVTTTDTLTGTTTDVIIASAHSDIDCAITPTAAMVSISGRAADSNGRGISGAWVTLTDASGDTRLSITNPFGFYRFDEVAAGELYVMGATHKSYIFQAQTVTPIEEISDFDLIGIQRVRVRGSLLR